MREDGIRNLIHGASNVLDGESLKRIDVGIRVNLNIFQGSLKGSQTLAFQKGVDGRGLIGGTVDAVLRPDFLQNLDQVDPLLRGCFLEHSQKTSCRS
jgi:hypothetical protein